MHCQFGGLIVMHGFRNEFVDCWSEIPHTSCKLSFVTIDVMIKDVSRQPLLGPLSWCPVMQSNYCILGCNSLVHWYFVTTIRITGFPRCRDFGKKSGIVICDSRPGNSREFHLFCLEFGKMRASEFFLKLKWWVMYFWQSRDASLAYLQARM